MKFAAATLQYKWGQSKAVKIVAVPYELLISYSTKKEREQKGGEQNATALLKSAVWVPFSL